MKKTFAATLVAACALGATVSQAATPEVEALLQAAQKEGAVYSVGMPNTLGQLGEDVERSSDEVQD